MTDILSFTWDDALREFLLDVKATRAFKTWRYYKVQLTGIAAWCVREEISFQQFGQRHLSRYLIERANAGKSQLTLHHDAITTKAFFAWCPSRDSACPPTNLTRSHARTVAAASLRRE